MKTGNYIFLSIALSMLLQAEPLLPKNILIEQYLISAQRYENDNKCEKAKKEFEKIENLQENLPNEFYYLYAQNLYRTDNFSKAKEYFSVYLRDASRQDKYYKDALVYLGQIDEKKSDEMDRINACDGLAEKVEEELYAVERECESDVDDQIIRDMAYYPNTTTTQMYNKWYPECLKKYKKKKYNKLTRKYRKNRCKEYE